MVKLAAILNLTSHCIFRSERRYLFTLPARSKRRLLRSSRFQRRTCCWVLILSYVVAGCGEDGTESTGISLPTRAPTSITMVAVGEFSSPGDAVASPDGSVFFFTANTLEPEPKAGIFSVPSEGGAVELLYSGEPLETPTGLVMSCDGAMLYIADMSLDEGVGPSGSQGGSIYELDTNTKSLTKTDISGIAVPSGLAMDSDCSTIYISGFNIAREPALFAVNITSSTSNGGSSDRIPGAQAYPRDGSSGVRTARTLYSGDPLVSPTGVHVDEDDVAWVMDHLSTESDAGKGALFSIALDGSIDIVLSDLRIGAPGGVTLAAGGVTAVIPEVDRTGNSQLISVNTNTGARSLLPTPEIVAPAGIRTARNAGVFVVVDNAGNAIFRAE